MAVGNPVLKLFVLLTGLTVLFVLLGQAIGGVGGMVVAGLFALLLNAGSYWFSDKIVLRMAGARVVDAAEAPQLYQLTATLAERARLPMPKLAIIDSQTPNAFATGRGPSTGVVAVTTGIMRLLTRDELAGVIAHELAHIKHRDILLSTVVATIAGAISMIANIGQWTLLLGGSNQDEEGGGSLVSSLLLIIVAPIAAMLIQFGISRAREFQADEGGARILGDPLPLASALEKIEWAAHQLPMAANPATASLYIVNPLSGGSALGGLARLFSTHPPTDQRIHRLRALAQRVTTDALLVGRR